MGTHLRAGALASLIVVAGCAGTEGSSEPEIAPGSPMANVTPAAAAIELGVAPSSLDESGVPRLLRATPAASSVSAISSALSGRTVDAGVAARAHVERLAPAWGVSAAGVPELSSLGEVEFPGGKVVQLRQRIDGLPVERGSGGDLRVMVRDDGSLVAASGALISATTPRTSDPAKLTDGAAAIARAISDLYQRPFSAAALAAPSAVASGANDRLAGSDGELHVSLSRSHKAWYLQGKQLRQVYVVEAYSSRGDSTSGDAFRSIVTLDGRVIDRTNLRDDVAFTYRVFAETSGERRPLDGPTVDNLPHPTGLPGAPFPALVAPVLVTIDGLNHPSGSPTPDPWLPAARTETFGNNVDAYTDLNAPDGLTFGDFRATTTSAGTFDRSYDHAQGPLASQHQQMAGITQLFYIINYLHDFWYDAGFTEAAGNGQNLNFNRGGEDRDALNAEAQDNANGGSRNNANMSTPADGFPPRMQVFVWDGRDDRTLGVANRAPATGPAAFGPRRFELFARAIIAADGTGASPTDACEPLTAPATGLIVLADRGNCTFKTKALNIQNAGGAGMLLADNAVSQFPPTLGDDAAITTPITIAILSVTQAEGAQIKADIAAGPTNARMGRVVGPDLEGTLDATVIAHEFGHYLHRRLQGCTTALCSAQSEGWGDFVALMLAASAGDNFDGAFPVGSYSRMGAAADPGYFGIRRVPYSASQSFNALSFRHMADPAVLPNTHPIAPGGVNSEVHNSGEVWATMLWEGYAALQKQPGASFTTVRRRMMQYVVNGLMLAPVDSTPTETRDAILAAAHAARPVDHDILAAAFARRGFGSCAISPPRASINFVGIVESFDLRGTLTSGTPALATTRSCDGDDVLDAGETAQITVPVHNPGPVPLASVVVQLRSTTPGIAIRTPRVAIGAIGAVGTASATFEVELAERTTAMGTGDFVVDITSSGGCVNAIALPLSIGLNTDDRPAASATDRFDASTSVWTLGANSFEGVWTHTRKAALDGVWRGTPAEVPGDAAIVSPLLRAGFGPLTIAFAHRFSFEATAANALDGGVVEYALGNSEQWQDLATLANPGYTATLAGSPDTNLNPLAGRPAYARTSTGFPEAMQTVTLALGTQLAGQTFRVRFRIGSDSGGTGLWEVDNVAFTGILDTPFPVLIADAARCRGPGGGPGPGHDHDHDHAECGVRRRGCEAGAGAGLGALLGVLALLMLRRRRCCG